MEQLDRVMLPSRHLYCALLAKMGGLSHDLGKASVGFQEMLLSAIKGQTIQKDSVHHSWLSMKLLPLLLEKGLDWVRAWETEQSQHGIYDAAWALMEQGLNNTTQATQVIAGTHHKLFSLTDPPRTPQNYNRHSHITHPLNLSQTKLAGDLHPGIVGDLRRAWMKAEELRKKLLISPDQLRGITLIARAGLILADHKVSNPENTEYARAPASSLIANTRSDTMSEDRRGKNKGPVVVPYQDLSHHLTSVGIEAFEVIQHMLNMQLPGLAPITVNSLLAPPPPQLQSRFGWQDAAVAKARAQRSVIRGPILVFNCAQTGAGKTIANIKLACALSASEAPRISIALNLRSLTLQTGDALRKELGLSESQVATVIGDTVTQRLYEGSFFAQEEEAGRHTQPLVKGNSLPLPSWMNAFTSKSPDTHKFISANILVSTIDCIINAANPGKQGHHVTALIRLLSADLILDEVDNYEPSAMGAVLRLVYMAALSGRNVICSSATLPGVLASAISRAFAAGKRAGAGLTYSPNQERSPGEVLLVHDQLTPVVSQSDSLGYEDFIQQLDLQQSSSYTKLAKIIPGDTKNKMNAEIIRSIEDLHRDNHSRLQGKRVSFGLIRLANISEVMKLANILIKTVPGGRVATYHSRVFLIERHLKEKRMDLLLNRKSDVTLKEDRELRALIENTPGEDIKFIIIASPVEEVGRDHDFDWAIIEPSSLQSIIQTAGRVNRHRQVKVSQPNIHLMNRNFKWLTNNGPCFFYPGIESKKDSTLSYRSHALTELLSKKMGEIFPITSSLRFTPNLAFSQDEDRLIEKQIKSAVLALDPNDDSWLQQELYTRYPLRSSNTKTRFRLSINNDEQLLAEKLPPAAGTLWLKTTLQRTNRENSDWLSFDLNELLEACVTLGLSMEEGFSVELPGTPDGLRWEPSFGISALSSASV